MLKHKRGAKCPLLQKFVSSCLENSPGNFVATEDLFVAYKTSVSVWTDEDSETGQTKFLMKRSSFNRVGIIPLIAVSSHMVQKTPRWREIVHRDIQNKGN